MSENEAEHQPLVAHPVQQPLVQPNQGFAANPQLIEKFLENQTQELQLRGQELALQQQKDSNAFAFGKESLKAQIDDRKDQRLHEKGARKQKYYFSTAIILLVVLLIAYALHTGKDAFANEIVKDIVLLLGGGASGYGYARTYPVKSEPKSKAEQG